MLEILIKELYKNLFNIDYVNDCLYYNNELLSNNQNAIIIFLGLCNNEYKTLSETKPIFEYIKGSHYFNIKLFKNKKFIEYVTKYPPKKEFEYTYHKYKCISLDDYNVVNEKHIIKKYKNSFYISYYDINKYKLNEKYPNIKLSDCFDIKVDAIRQFFSKYNTIK